MEEAEQKKQVEDVMRYLMIKTGSKSILVVLGETSYPCENELKNLDCNTNHKLEIHCLGMSKEHSSLIMLELGRVLGMEVTQEKKSEMLKNSIPSPFNLKEK